MEYQVSQGQQRNRQGTAHDNHNWHYQKDLHFRTEREHLITAEGVTQYAHGVEGADAGEGGVRRFHLGSNQHFVGTPKKETHVHPLEHVISRTQWPDTGY